MGAFWTIFQGGLVGFAGRGDLPGPGRGGALRPGRGGRALVAA